jgi:K+-sensing histidine kinase KdpD
VAGMYHQIGTTLNAILCMGIAEECIWSLLNVFTQADTSTTHRCAGISFGVAICQQICSAMGGNILTLRSRSTLQTKSISI